MLVYMLES